MNVVDGSAGAGGNWATEAEREDSRAVAQQQSTFCGCACALIVLEMLGIRDLPTQEALFELGGSLTFSVESLAEVMNEVRASYGQAEDFIGGGVQPVQGSNYSEVVQILSRRGSWIAHMREPMERIGHFVVVERVVDEEVYILDPAGSGTSYRMKMNVFLQYWNWQAVYFG